MTRNEAIEKVAHVPIDRARCSTDLAAAVSLVDALEALGLIRFDDVVPPWTFVPVGREPERTVPRYPERRTAANIIGDIKIWWMHPAYANPIEPVRLGTSMGEEVVRALEAAGFKIVRIVPDAKD